MNLVRPCNVLEEIWTTSDPYYLPNGENPSANLVKWWWVLFLLESFAGRIASRTPVSLGEASSKLTRAWFFLASDTFSIFAGALAILMILEIDKRQEGRCQRISSSGV